MDKDRKSIVEAARTEAERMRSAVAGAEDGAQVSMTTGQFAKLAALLDGLADTVAFWPDETLDDPRYWVPLGHFQRLKAEAEHWQSECGRLTERQSFDGLLRF